MKKTTIALFITVIISGTLHSADTDIRLNSLGFLPMLTKRASIAAPCDAFEVKRASDDSAAYSGNAFLWGTNTDTGETIYMADFSALHESGTFYLDVPGVGQSYNFDIGYDLYKDHFYTVARGFYLWRCGTAVSGTHNGVTFSHAACHLDDGYLDYVGGGHVIKDGIGGWHDAGDYGKYIINSGVTVGVMLKAWEHFGEAIDTISLDIPESGGAIPDFLAEIKYNLDWIRKMQMDDGRVYFKLTRTNFSSLNLMPEYDTADRYFVPWSSAATASFTAMMAMASRIYAPYDAAFADDCLDAARVSYAYLTNNPTDVQPNLSGFSTGYYTTNDTDDRLWAAAEMWEATGDASILADFETRANSYSDKIEWAMDWGSVKDLGMFTYYFSSRTGKNSVIENDIRNDTINRANLFVNERNGHGYARNMGTNYWWGINGHTVRRSLTLYLANIMSPNMEYINTAFDAIGFVAGRNYNCRSMITGMGYNPPMYPHDRRSNADGIIDPWPGYLVGGPSKSGDGTFYYDSVTDASVNEIAINWNSGLLIAMAGLLDGVITPTPTITVTGTPPTLTVTPTITPTMTPTPRAQENLNTVYVYPSLVDMTKGVKEVCFYNMMPQSGIFLYNMAGELVYKTDNYSVDGERCLSLVNRRKQEKWAPGVYLYIITNESGTMVKKGRIAIIR